MFVVYKLSYVKIFKMRRFSIVWLYYLIYSLVLFIHSCCISLVIYDLKLKYSDEQKDANVRWVYIQVSFHWEIWEYEFVILLCNPNEAHMSLQTPLDLKHLWKSNRESQNIPFHRKEAAWQQCESHFCTFTRSAWHLLNFRPSNM